jgi:hypothetical protein
MTLPRGKGAYSQVMHWMKAARYSGVGWDRFRRLDRETQGQIVAFYEADTALEYLGELDAIKRARRRQLGGKSRV